MGCNFSASSVGRVTPSGGDVINKAHFDVERVIGQGGFAKVNAVVKNRGHDKGTWYAMKSLQKAVIIERNHLAMVMKERNLLARLHCPQLVNMHYAFQDDKNLFIVMDVCLGGDLHYQLTHSPTRCFSEEQAKFYAASTILCLEYMHSVGVMHRDVKPENLLLDKSGNLKVTDLGISMEVVDGICTSTSGTRPYMAPEIFMTGHRHGFVADFYSLGITVYQFLLGQRPYKPDTANMKAIVRMATFVPPEKYTDIKQIRKILIAAQERKAPSAEFRYGSRLAKASAEARDFVQSCLICNPKFRLGCRGVQELMSHPWFAGVDWDAMRAQRLAAPFLPDLKQANCSISDSDAAAILLNEEENDNKLPPVSPVDQAKFEGFDYRTRVKDNVSGRNERIIKQPSYIDIAGGGADRAPTITVTQTTEMLHSMSAYGSMRSSWNGSDHGSVSSNALKSPSSFSGTPALRSGSTRLPSSEVASTPIAMPSPHQMPLQLQVGGGLGEGSQVMYTPGTVHGLGTTSPNNPERRASMSSKKSSPGTTGPATAFPFDDEGSHDPNPGMQAQVRRRVSLPRGENAHARGSDASSPTMLGQAHKWHSAGMEPGTSIPSPSHPPVSPTSIKSKRAPAAGMRLNSPLSNEVKERGVLHSEPHLDGEPQDRTVPPAPSPIPGFRSFSLPAALND